MKNATIYSQNIKNEKEIENMKNAIERIMNQTIESYEKDLLEVYGSTDVMEINNNIEQLSMGEYDEINNNITESMQAAVWNLNIEDLRPLALKPNKNQIIEILDNSKYKKLYWEWHGLDLEEGPEEVADFIQLQASFALLSKTKTADIYNKIKARKYHEDMTFLNNWEMDFIEEYAEEIAKIIQEMNRSAGMEKLDPEEFKSKIWDAELVNEFADGAAEVYYYYEFVNLYKEMIGTEELDEAIANMGGIKDGEELQRALQYAYDIYICESIDLEKIIDVLKEIEAI